MSTPGTIKRRLNSAWQREGSYLLFVDTVGNLPGSPDEDGIFAWVNGTSTLYYSQAGAWHAYASGGGGLPLVYDRAYRNANQTGLVTGWNKVLLDTVETGANITIGNSRWICPATGYYQVFASVSWATGVATRALASVWLNGAEWQRGADYATPTNNAGGIVAFTDYFNAGDYLELYTYVNPVTTNIFGGRFFTYLGVRQLTTQGVQGPQGVPGVGGSPYAIYANYAALPQTGLTAGQMATTVDTGTAWIWTGTAWRPQGYFASAGIVLTGTIPTSGSVVLGTLTVAAQPFDRRVVVSGMMLPGGVAACSYQLMLSIRGTGVSADIAARVFGGTTQTATVNAVATLCPANVALTITGNGSYSSGGTATAASVTNDSRFNRLDYQAYAL